MNLPLADIFSQLRAAGMPLGTEEYILLVRALQAGFGQPDRADLERLCRMLWVKSEEDDAILHLHFARAFPLLEPVEAAGSDANRPDSTDTVFGPEREPEKATTAPLSAAPKRGVRSIPSSVITDEILAQAAHRDLPEMRFLRSTEYFPVTRREMKQTWRYMRRRIRTGPPVEVDLDETVATIRRHGVLLEPVLVPARLNRAKLLLLIDQDGSMTPFHQLSRRLSETATRGGQLGMAQVYYFHNCPEEFIYRDEALTEPVDFAMLVSSISNRQVAALIFSDAGAARGALNPKRLAATRTFLERIRKWVLRVAWMNPMPQNRWSGTTAAKIAAIVPMHEFSRRGMDHAIDLLRGRSQAAIHA
jgi:uncharacterized protein with von Willebrand factor type A (vWA) domain